MINKEPGLNKGNFTSIKSHISRLRRITVQCPELDNHFLIREHKCDVDTFLSF